MSSRINRAADGAEKAVRFTLDLSDYLRSGGDDPGHIGDLIAAARDGLRGVENATQKTDDQETSEISLDEMQRREALSRVRQYSEDLGLYEEEG